MLANRADIYNLGDVLGGKEEVFALSYLENSLTSNPVIAPLATRDMSDIYKFLDMAKGINVPTTDLSHQYSSAEVKEIVAVLQKMQVIQNVVWKVNQAYIAASAQDDKYRTEPTFKLQGSYRNMNKMVEKISSIMTDDELVRLVDDHYQGESQLLTSGTEANLLKLAEIRNCMTNEQTTRWEKIKADFIRDKAMGGDDADTGSKIVVQLNDLVAGINSWKESTEKLQSVPKQTEDSDNLTNQSLTEIVNAIENLSVKLTNSNKSEVKSDELPSQINSLSEVFENTLQPLLKIMSGKLDLDLGTHQKMSDINDKLELISQQPRRTSKSRGLFGDTPTMKEKDKGGDK